MMSFCKHTLHNYLTKKRDQRRRRNQIIPSSRPGGLSLISTDCGKPSNVVESVIVKRSSSNDSLVDLSSKSGCFLDEICSGGGGGVDGLSSCTESLGFESSDQMEKEMVTDVNETMMRSKPRSTVGMSFRKESRESSRWRERVKKLPPPLSSLNSHGQSSFFMKAVRENGRLVLTEMNIDRPEIFHASRENGRLRLQLVRSDDDDEEEEEEEEEKEWRVQMNSGGGEGFRRCYELSNHHKHHHPHHVPFWNQQQCVTSR